jgi:hypothetical protein
MTLYILPFHQIVAQLAAGVWNISGDSVQREPTLLVIVEGRSIWKRVIQVHKNNGRKSTL